MLDALTARAAPTPAPALAPDAAPTGLSVVDTSDTGADLAWMPLAGAAIYRVSRAGADGQFSVVGDTAGPGFGDTGLSPKSAYRWRISVVVNGTESPPSAEVSATTRPTPAPCDHPGSCPIANNDGR